MHFTFTFDSAIKHVVQGDDSKTVHQNALSALQELETLNQNSPPTAPKVESSSSTEMKTAGDLEADNRRIFLMNKVIDILKRNVRVRYEIKVLDLFRMCVHSTLAWSIDSNSNL